MNTSSAAANVVLVHGGFVDGSGWQAVYDLLKQDGYHVSVVQNPTLSLEGDVAATRQVIDAQDGPVVLVGHSYGGAVITEAGTDANVAALVYIAAFAPDKGESVNTLIADPPPGAPVPPILPPKDGFLLLDREKFPAAFAGDVPADQAAFMADSQVPWGVGALGGSITEPAWRIKPSWYLVATEDRPQGVVLAEGCCAGSPLVHRLGRCVSCLRSTHGRPTALRRGGVPATADDRRHGRSVAAGPARRETFALTDRRPTARRNTTQ